MERRKQGKKRERKKSVAVFSGIDDAVGVVGVVVGVVDVGKSRTTSSGVDSGVVRAVRNPPSLLVDSIFLVVVFVAPVVVDREFGFSSLAQLYSH